ncbi:uncharacterized protein lrriq3 isoform X2 [Brachyhypopomus gauderio]|uniref:uncharacterized protein lrriq3 isoform X2 n=1 Tax=Brachyhypopomus gauderio TaxID=698409 RepID=UPI0040410274
MEAVRTYLLNCSESLILQHGHSTSAGEQPTHIQEVALVTLSSLLLKTLDYIGHCKALRICVLADNVLSRIDPLVECVHLVKLDLRGNQISHLPSSSFWRNLKDLQLLILHDNNMVMKKDVSGLSGCPNLFALTLYDTPLSLQVGYRHCVINTIWSLKALDKHVISDEEIVENWHLPSKFKAKGPQFGVNLYPQIQADSYDNEIKVVHGIIAEINRIQAVYSPVLIIQKWIRGHLARRHLGFSGRLCGSVCPWRGLARTSPSARTQVSPPSPGTGRGHRTRQHWAARLQKGQKEDDLTFKKLHVNLSKLMQEDCKEIQQDVISARSLDSTKLQNLTVPCNTPQRSATIKPSGDVDVADLHPMDTESFRLFGLKATMHLSEPFADILMSRKADGQDIREAIGRFHKQKGHPPSIQQPRPPKPRPPTITVEERLIGRCYERPSLRLFQEVERAYGARKKAEDFRARAERVAQVRELRTDAHRHRDDFREARRKEAHEQREQERAEVEQTMLRHRARREQEVQLVRQNYVSFCERKRTRQAEREKVESFARQHMMLDAAVVRQCTRHTRMHLLCEKRQRLLANRIKHPGTASVVSHLATHSLLLPDPALLGPKAPKECCV